MVLGHCVLVVGVPLGTALGSFDGASECIIVGIALGTIVGNAFVSTDGKVGVEFGRVLGLIDGDWLSSVDGTLEGSTDGTALGPVDGVAECIADELLVDSHSRQSIILSSTVPAV